MTVTFAAAVSSWGHEPQHQTTQDRLEDKTVFVLTARGATYSAGMGSADSDFQEPYLRRVLGFIGLADVTFVHAEGLGRRDQVEASRAAAFARIERLIGRTTQTMEGAAGKS